MLDTKHTAGPWTIDVDDRPGMNWNIHIVEAARPHHRVCFMASDGQNEANAHLIAAAPAMLQALMEFVSMFPCVPGSIGDEVRQAARAAIAKACNVPITDLGPR